MCRRTRWVWESGTGSDRRSSPRPGSGRVPTSHWGPYRHRLRARTRGTQRPKGPVPRRTWRGGRNVPEEDKPRPVTASPTVVPVPPLRLLPDAGSYVVMRPSSTPEHDGGREHRPPPALHPNSVDGALGELARSRPHLFPGTGRGRRLPQLFPGPLEEVLEQRAPAGGDDTDDSRAENRAVHPEVRRQSGRHDGRKGTARDLGDAQVDPLATRIGRFTHTRNLPAFPLLDRHRATDRTRRGRTAETISSVSGDCVKFATFMIGKTGCRRPSRKPCHKLDGAPIHAHGPNGVLLRALGPVPHQGVRGLEGPPGGG